MDNSDVKNSLIKDKPVKKSEETLKDFKIRICKNKDLYNLTWPEIAVLINQESGENFSESAYRKWWNNYYEGYQDAVNQSISDSEILKEIEQNKNQLEKEKIKVQTEKLELRQWLRESARIELFEEKLEKYLKSLSSVNIPNYRIEQDTKNSYQVITGIADSHYGKEIKIYGLKDEVLNEYNPEIFEKRMWDLLNKQINIIEKENIKSLYFYDLGDSIDGMLRISQLQSLKYGIIESTIRYAEFMTNYLNELSRYVYIDYHSSLGNHSEIRPLNSKSGEFYKENVEKIVNWHLRHRLSENPNININACKGNIKLNNIAGINVVSIHGQDNKDLEQSLKDYSLFYNEKIDVLLAGHWHFKRSQGIGMDGEKDIEIIQFPSICGIDDYSVKLKKASMPGSKMVILNENEKITYDIVL